MEVCRVICIFENIQLILELILEKYTSLFRRKNAMKINLD